MRFTLQQKITASILITFVAAAIAFSAVLIPLQKLRTRNAIEKSTGLLRILFDRESDTLANALFENRIRAVRMRIQDILRLDGMLSVTVYDKDFKVVAHGDRKQLEAEPLDAEDGTHRNEIHVYRSEWHQFPSLFFDAPITALQKPLGYIRTIYSIADIERERRLSYFLTGVLLLTILFLMILVLHFLMSRVVRKPISALHEAMQIIQTQGPGFVVPVTASDEIGDLIDAFNRMSRTMQKLLRQIRWEITDRQGAEKAFRESEYRFRTLVDSSPEGIALFDLDGTVKTGNRSLARITGHELREIEGRPFSALLTPEARRALETAMADLKKGIRQNTPLEISFRKKDGAEIALSIRGWIVTEENNRPVAMGAFISDITRRKRLAEEKKRLESQLLHTQKMEAIATLSGGIAHDFNNILSGILGYTELALVDLGDDHPESRKYLTRSLEASKRAKDLVQQILRFSRKDAGVRGPVSIKSLLKEAIALIRSTLPKTIRIEERITAEKEVVMGDATQLHQVIVNLCVNAYHAMKASGGTLTVTLSETVVKSPRVRHGTECPAGDYLQLSIQDTGCGIPPELLDRIFDPYFTTKKSDEGTGLGLSVSLGIVKNHGGVIHVESTPGVGTCFTVYLPQIEEETRTTESDAPSVPKGRSEKILVVDDEAFFCDVASETLGGLDYRVVACRSSLQALETFQADPDGFDAVITDQTMPEMTGVQLVAEIRRINGDIPIILCTGYSDDVTEASAGRLGITKLIYKPISREQMGAAVHEVLGEHTPNTGRGAHEARAEKSK